MFPIILHFLAFGVIDIFFFFLLFYFLNIDLHVFLFCNPSFLFLFGFLKKCALFNKEYIVVRGRSLATSPIRGIA